MDRLRGLSPIPGIGRSSSFCQGFSSNRKAIRAGGMLAHLRSQNGEAQSATGTVLSGEEQVIPTSLEGPSANGACIQAITNKLPRSIKALKAGMLQHVQR